MVADVRGRKPAPVDGGITRWENGECQMVRRDPGDLTGVFNAFEQMSHPAIRLPSQLVSGYIWHMGSFASIITLAISSGALVVAVLAFLESRRLRRIEEAREDRASVERRREQAARLAIWMSVETLDSTWEQANGVIRNHTQIILEVKNTSDAPVYDICISATDVQYLQGKRLDTPKELEDLVVHTMPPGHLVFGPGQGVHAWDLGKSPEAHGALVPVTKSKLKRITKFTFTDADGVQWCRDADGSLKELASRHAQKVTQSPLGD